VRQLLHDAGAKGLDAYPSQKSIGSCHESCGDFLMLPLGIDEEKRISEFVDPRTFEPVEFVEVEKVICLRDMSDSKTETNNTPPEENGDQR
jgi:hypothetical protein